MNKEDFINKNRHLFWYIKKPDKLTDEAVVEAILNYGDWDDVQEIIQILGMSKTAAIFRDRSKNKRSNYRPRIKNYFELFFNKHA